MTREQRSTWNKQRRTALRALLNDGLAAEIGTRNDHDRTQAIDHARHIGVTITSYGGLAPFVVTGTVDGRSFFLRSRHEAWRIEIADDDTPDTDPWTDHSCDTIEIASGPDHLLATSEHPGYDPVTVIDTCVTAVRTHLRTSTCTHSRREPPDLYCRDCGSPSPDATSTPTTTSTSDQRKPS